MELIVQKATELGAHRIVPILSARTVAQVETEDIRNKLENGKPRRWKPQTMRFRLASTPGATPEATDVSRARREI